MLDKIIFGHITTGMLIAFLAGVIGVFMAGHKLAKEAKLKTGYSAKKYIKLTPFNVVYQLFIGLALLFISHEIYEKLVGVSTLDNDGIYHWTMAMACGAFGGQIFAYVIEFGRKKLNTRDENIIHKHDENCDH